MKRRIAESIMTLLAGAAIGAVVFAGYLSFVNERWPVEITVLKEATDRYAVEIRNTDGKTISVRTTYLDDRKDTGPIRTFLLGSKDYDCPVDKIREDMVCECETMPVGLVFPVGE